MQESAGVEVRLRVDVRLQTPERIEGVSKSIAGAAEARVAVHGALHTPRSISQGVL